MYLRPGLGGIHNESNKINKSENLGYYENPWMFANSDENHLILMLDFQSFYVNIIIKLLDNMPKYKTEASTLKELNEIRLKLKKRKKTQVI